MEGISCKEGVPSMTQVTVASDCCGGSQPFYRQPAVDLASWVAKLTDKRDDGHRQRCSAIG